MIIIAIMFAQNSVGSLCCDVWHKCLTFVCFSGLVLPSSVGYHLKLNNLCDFLICFISWSGLSHTYHLTFRHVHDQSISNIKRSTHFLLFQINSSLLFLLLGSEFRCLSRAARYSNKLFFL